MARETSSLRRSSVSAVRVHLPSLDTLYRDMNEGRVPAQMDAILPMRRNVEPDIALSELRVHAEEGAALQPRQIAMDQPWRGLGCAAAEIALLEQDHAQAAPSGVARDADAIQPTTDDREIVVRHTKTV
jgi:hypothetical protein